MKDINWDNLEELYIEKKMSSPEIAKLKGCSPPTLRNHLRKQGIEIRKTAKYDWRDLEDLYLKEQLSMDEIAIIKVCPTCTVYAALKSRNIPIRTHKEAARLAFSKHKMRDYKGSNHPRWKGGRIKTPLGYIIVYKPNHPYANKTGRVMEHRLVMEEKLGRYLFPWEVVHHKGTKYPMGSIENRGDNRVENLVIYPSHSEHIVPTRIQTRLNRLELEVRELRKSNRLLQWQIKELKEALQYKLED